MTGPVMLRHNRIDLALHELRAGDGPTLLCLHGLGENSALPASDVVAAWPGRIVGLDFTGHGASTVPIGGGYSCEVLMGDADVALAHTGPATVLGRGLGAYVALMIAGARPDLVRGAVLADGPGLAGGAIGIAGTPWLEPPSEATAPDRMALAELAIDRRPPDYAMGFARLSLASSELDQPLIVSAVAEPPWLEAVRAEPGVAAMSTVEAVRVLAAG